MARAVWFAAALLCTASAANAHELRPAYLELKQIGAESYDVLWKVPARGENLRFGLHLRMPDQTQVVTPPTALFLGGAHVERWRIVRPGGLVGSEIWIEGLSSTLTDVLVRIERADGSTQVARLTPEHPSFVVDATPRALEVVETYARLGVEHILGGIDHLLFVLALLLLVEGWRRLIGTITAFTVAHSITLAAATLGVLRVPGPPVEAVIALSIAFVAAEIVHRSQGRAGWTERRPWLVSFGFGLLHGLGFAGALREAGLPESAVPLALAFFNLGVEIGQLAFVAMALASIALLRRVELPLPRWAGRLPPYAIGATAMFWVIERVAAF